MTTKISSLWNFTRQIFPTLGMVLLAGCASAPKVEPKSAAATEITVNVKSARSAYESGNFARAAKFYELALARARALDDSSEIGRNAYNAAACHLRAGDAKSAAALLVEADREFERSKMNRSSVLVLRSRVAAQLGSLSDAQAFGLSAVAAAKSADEKTGALIALAGVALQQEDFAAAGRLLASARSERLGPAMHAAVVTAEGRLFEAQAKNADAGKKFDSAAALWREANNAVEMAAALQSAGNVFAKAGDAGKSADLLYRAARSYFGQHDSLSALRCVEAAMKSAEAAKDEKLRDEIAALFAQIKKSVEPVAESN